MNCVMHHHMYVYLLLVIQCLSNSWVLLRLWDWSLCLFTTTVSQIRVLSFGYSSALSHLFLLIDYFPPVIPSWRCVVCATQMVCLSTMNLIQRCNHRYYRFIVRSNQSWWSYSKHVTVCMKKYRTGLLTFISLPAISQPVPWCTLTSQLQIASKHR